MPRLSVSKGLALVLLAASAAGARAESASLKFDDAFAVRHASSVHYQARFVAGDGSEQGLEAWRDGERRVKRVTNGQLVSIAQHQPGDAEYDLRVIDLRRKLLTTISRTNLLRVGNFTEWFGLAHGLQHPRRDYRLASAAAPADAPATPASCAWFDLEQQGHTNHVCWNAQAQLPLAIVNDSGRVVWHVTKLEMGRVADGVFRVDTRNLVVNDANRDMERD